jgi:hypothetical protein
MWTLPRFSSRAAAAVAATAALEGILKALVDAAHEPRFTSGIIEGLVGILAFIGLIRRISRGRRLGSLALLLFESFSLLFKAFFVRHV